MVCWCAAMGMALRTPDVEVFAGIDPGVDWSVGAGNGLHGMAVIDVDDAITHLQPPVWPLQTVDVAAAASKRVTVDADAVIDSGRMLITAHRFTGMARYTVIVRNDGDHALAVRLRKAVPGWWGQWRESLLEVAVASHAQQEINVAGLRAQEQWYADVAPAGASGTVSGATADPAEAQAVRCSLTVQRPDAGR